MQSITSTLGDTLSGARLARYGWRTAASVRPSVRPAAATLILRVYVDADWLQAPLMRTFIFVAAADRHARITYSSPSSSRLPAEFTRQSPTGLSAVKCSLPDATAKRTHYSLVATATMSVCHTRAKHFKSGFYNISVQSGFYWTLIRPAASVSEVTTLWRCSIGCTARCLRW